MVGLCWFLFCCMQRRHAWSGRVNGCCAQSGVAHVRHKTNGLFKSGHVAVVFATALFICTRSRPRNCVHNWSKESTLYDRREQWSHNSKSRMQMRNLQARCTLVFFYGCVINLIVNIINVKTGLARA